MNIQSYHRGKIENAHTDCFGAGVAPAAHADRRIYANFILCFVGFMVLDCADFFIDRGHVTPSSVRWPLEASKYVPPKELRTSVIARDS